MYNPKKFGRVAVLAGGPSSERAISIKSGRAVYKALKKAGCDVAWVELDKTILLRRVKNLTADIAFLALHGGFGEGGEVQRILENRSIPYTGSGVKASKSALDKIAAKKIFKKHGIPTPSYRIISKRDKKGAENFSYPLVIKPRSEGSSIGLSIVIKEKELDSALKRAFRHSDKVIAERFIKGREITVGILDKNPLPVIEIVSERDFYDFYAKYKDKKTRYIVPALLPESVYKKAQELGLRAHEALKCKDFSRVDMIVSDNGDIFVLEVNTIPGLTARSLLPKAAGLIGLAFDELCIKLLELGLKNKGSKI